MQLAFDFERTARPAPTREVPWSAANAARPLAPRDPRSALEARIAAALAVPVDLVVTDNRRSMISTRRLGPKLEVRLHHMFLDAPRAVIEELLCYLAEGDARSSRALGHFIEANRHLVKRPRRILLRTRGRHHDLAEIFREVVATYFPEGVGDVRITWGKLPPQRGKRRSIRLGTYTQDHDLIRIHPALDQAVVPRFFVEFVVFHELLHAVVPARRAGSRIDYHPPEFRRRERAHPDYARAVRWERENIEVLLGFRS